MAMYGKRGGSSAAVLDAPERDRAQETQWPIPEPAPAGTLQRRSAQAERQSSASRDAGREAGRETGDEVYRPRRESVGHRLRLGLLKTTGGRIVGATAVFAVLGAAVFGILGMRRSLLHDPRFAIASSSEIQIVGNRHLTRAQVLSVFGADLERNIFKIPLAERRSDLERLPWVAHATVMRLLPDGLRVAITERVPVAFVRQGSQIGLVDAAGVLLDMPQDAAGDPHYSFPVLTGLSGADPLSTRAARMEVYRRFMRDLDSSGEKLTDSLSEVDVSNPEDVKAVVTSGGADVLVHFGDENFLGRYKLYEQNLPQWKTQYPKLASVDTRYENEFVLEMQPGSAVPLAGDVPGETVAAAKVVKTETKPGKEPAVKKAAVAVTGHKPLETAKAKAKPASGKKPILVHAYNPNQPATPTTQGR